MKEGIYCLLPPHLDSYDCEQEDVFNKVHSGYDEYLNKHPFYTLIRDNYVLPYWFKDDFRGKAVLDLGCVQDGRHQLYYKKPFLTNLDISSGNLKFTKGKLGKIGQHMCMRI